MKGERIIMLLLMFILVFLVISIYTFMQARDQLAHYNKDAIHNCYMLDCDILPFGKLQCRQVGISDMVDVKDMVHIGG